jgi:cephalosporin-C deacetylase-like acetyl esterase
MRPFSVRLVALAALPLLLAPSLVAEDATLPAKLRALDGTVLPKSAEPAQLLRRDIRARLRAADERSTAAWAALDGKASWEKFRDARLAALKASLGTFPVPKDLRVRVTGTIEGDGYRIENLVFESRPGLVVTANLYLPSRPAKAAPGILICHSHHAPKTQGELQDMGMLWARAGCYVLVMDQLGHGERRQHPFRDKSDFPAPFRVSRQDYYFRHVLGLQLHLAGESLIGWMAHDLMRGVDLLLARPGLDKGKIILLGAVAGGGDPAAVTAALDRRIAAAVPFNFGGPQPETTFPLPPDAKRSFRYTGSGSWESTRNLYRSAADGFLPWVIVGATAPRPLVYAHEFAWDRAHDPVWARLRTIYGWYGARDRLASTHGKGKVTGRPPEATHCTNIGAVHRAGFYPDFQRWFGIRPPAKEVSEPRPAKELMCLTKGGKGRPVHELAAALAAERSAAARKRRERPDTAAGRRQLRRDWAGLLGDIEPKGEAKALSLTRERLGTITVERLRLEVEKGMPVPVLLLLPPAKPKQRLPVVVAFAQAGKQAFLNERAAELARLLEGGVAVALPDLRGTGETRPGADRGRTSAATALASSELMLGRTMLGARLLDLRGVLRYLRTRDDLDGHHLALWGESFAPVNADGKHLFAPLDAPKPPALAEPLGGLLALLAAMFEDQVTVVYARGGLLGYQPLLQAPFCNVPYDVIVPGAAGVGDLADVAAALAPRALRLEGVVDGLNRRVSAKDLERALPAVREAYRAQRAEGRLEAAVGPPRGGPAGWLLERLREKGPAPQRGSEGP